MRLDRDSPHTGGKNNPLLRSDECQVFHHDYVAVAADSWLDFPPQDLMILLLVPARPLEQRPAGLLALDFRSTFSLECDLRPAVHVEQGPAAGVSLRPNGPTSSSPVPPCHPLILLTPYPLPRRSLPEWHSPYVADCAAPRRGAAEPMHMNLVEVGADRPSC